MIVYSKPGQAESRMSVKAVIFDMDGTILDTLPDLTALTNAVLAEFGCKTYETSEIKGFIGDGVRTLMLRAMPSSASSAQKEEALREWKRRYSEFGQRETAPYAGILELLTTLKSKGIRLGVLSNKFDNAVKALAEEYFSGLFDIVQGESASCPKKPDPTGLLNEISSFGLTPDSVAYVGDSAGDMLAAKAAGAFAIGASWGYQSLDKLVEGGADSVIDNPLDILELI